MSAVERVLVGPKNPTYQTAGVELGVTICGAYSRFAMYRVRTSSGGECFCIRDAETVTDAQMRDGVRPSIVSNCASLREAWKFAALRSKRTNENTSDYKRLSPPEFRG